MQSIHHKDVWMEIMYHFKLFLSEDKPSDIKVKKHTLLSLALTNRNLTDIALNELWRSMSSLMPIVCILNDTTTTSSSAAVTPVLRWNRDYWEIGSLSSNANKCLVSRISPYLSRVESLHFSVFPSLDEYMLWHALSTFEQILPICPRLRELSISIDAKSASWAYNVTPLVASRSLKRIKLDASPDALQPKWLPLSSWTH
ncbi:hypothetical protein D9756_008501 [Leucocoprinus leucothites]|uniref:Uncharacterized protein n=1 Tax=Leucocoprinus leucothites TaxID=201217 RepID=A0A8H5CZ52_9AGAR|nr:hypothetical protein D9756_008501 [Leucoagaricus leucothites]